jgi:hypothetical protein
MRSFYKVTLFFVVISVLISVVGCYTKSGSFNSKSHFTYPNSNIEPLGPVSASDWKFSILFPRSWDANEINKLIHDAVSTQAGAADMLINYKLSSSVFFPFLPIPVLSFIDIEGTAVKVTIGKKELMELK